MLLVIQETLALAGIVELVEVADLEDTQEPQIGTGAVIPIHRLEVEEMAAPAVVAIQVVDRQGIRGPQEMWEMLAQSARHQLPFLKHFLAGMEDLRGTAEMAEVAGVVGMVEVQGEVQFGLMAALFVHQTPVVGRLKGTVLAVAAVTPAGVLAEAVAMPVLAAAAVPEFVTQAPPGQQTLQLRQQAETLVVVMAGLLVLIILVTVEIPQLHLGLEAVAALALAHHR